MEARFQKKDGVLYLHVATGSTSDRIVMAEFARQMEKQKAQCITWGHGGKGPAQEQDEIGLLVFSNKEWHPPEPPPKPDKENPGTPTLG